jgi:LURP-one-related
MEQAVISEKYCSDTERELTVRKTSLFAQGDGFAVYDHCTGELAFRVDMYPAVSDELVLMDPGGAPVLTVRKKRPSLHNRWEGFAGERADGHNQKPLFTVRRYVRRIQTVVGFVYVLKCLKNLDSVIISIIGSRKRDKVI